MCARVPVLLAILGVDCERRNCAAGGNPFAFLSEDSTRDLRVVMKVREVRELMLDIVSERRAEPADGEYDFLSMYIDARDKDGVAFTDDELLDELVTLIVAGYETSAGTLNWAWYLLAHNPDVESRLLAEAASLDAREATVDADMLTNMTFAQQLLEETLRLYPPVWLFTRRCIDDDEIGGFDVRPGTDVYLSPYVLHRTASHWPQPDRFDPDRFGPDAAYSKGDRPYFPFSLGPRRCLGEYFSFLEMKVHLALLIRRFRMTLVADEPPGLDLGINLRSAGSIELQPQLRENA